eukprot:5562771-Prymnesium_polylepis.1
MRSVVMCVKWRHQSGRRAPSAQAAASSTVCTLGPRHCAAHTALEETVLTLLPVGLRLRQCRPPHRILCDCVKARLGPRGTSTGAAAQAAANKA